jgi:Putative AphA-like transcriptional regulator
MRPSDVALLVVLGTADSGRASIEDIVGVARMLAPQDWQPTADAIRLCAERAILEGLLQPVPDNGAKTDGALETTTVGRVAIVELLRQPIGPSCGEMIRACMSAKLCFLHHLPLPERGEHGENLARLYRDAVEQLRRLQRLPRPLAGSASCTVRHEIVRMESELAWLDGMRRCCPGNRALDDTTKVEDTNP